MRRVGLLLLTAILAGPAHGQTKSGQTVSAQTASALTCGVLKAESSRASSTFQWNIFVQIGLVVLVGLACKNAILVVEFTSTAGHSFFDAYFADGTNIGYGRQQIDRRGSRFVLPIQAKARIAAPFRAAFDYHCRLNMPADPIQPAARADCVF